MRPEPPPSDRTRRKKRREGEKREREGFSYTSFRAEKKVKRRQGGGRGKKEPSLFPFATRKERGKSRKASDEIRRRGLFLSLFLHLFFSMRKGEKIKRERRGKERFYFAIFANSMLRGKKGTTSSSRQKKVPESSKKEKRKEGREGKKFLTKSEAVHHVKEKNKGKRGEKKKEGKVCGQ